MSQDQYKSALVTGASSGIGEAIVRQLSAKGLEVHAVARRTDKLEALAAETGCKTYGVDLLDTDAIYDTLSKIEVDVLVNNAGLGLGMDGLPTSERGDIDTTVDTNVKAVMHLTRAMLPGMMARKHGHIINISSVAGLYPIKASIYGATKGAIHLFSQNLRIEIQGSKVRVTEICPARVGTDFFRVAFGEARAKDPVKGFKALTPDDIAEAVVFAVDKPQRVNISLIEVCPTEQIIGGVGIVETD
ncbi:MAG: oxidoreductase [Rhodospirillaceae bacterium]|nr:oxidoreductase [Rhodospirillaceae bacterium]|tara:strand:- start:649 stop:1383 length:735 start_codon:yes stop_codon:yes gene_type:complete